MGAFFSYMLQVALLMTAFYLVYKWLLGDTTFYRLNRFVIIGIYLLSWGLPLLWNVELSGKSSDAMPGLLEIGNLQAVTIAQEQSSSNSSWISYVIWLYFAGVLVSFLFFILDFIRLFHIAMSGEKRCMEGTTEIITPEAPGPFCWGRFIILRPQDLLENYNLISAHESTHVRLNHWVDLILGQLTLIFQWFSPAAWLMLRAMKVNHEYEVDEIVAGDNPAPYQMMLIKMTVGTRLPVLADSLNHSQLKKRLTMMMTKKSAPSRRFAALALPAVAVVACVTLSQPSVARVAEIISNTSLIPVSAVETLTTDKVNHYSQDVQPQVSNEDSGFQNAAVQNSDSESVAASDGSTEIARSDSPDSKSVKSSESLAYFIDGVLFKGELNSIPSDEIASMYVIKNDPDYPQGKLLIRTKKAAPAKVEESQTEKRIYLQSEAIAEYKGGMTELMNFLIQNLKFPTDLKEAKRVIVQFTIDPDGSVKDAKIVKSGGEACDAEALKAVEATSGNWIPGRQDGSPVATQFTLPVNFKPTTDKD